MGENTEARILMVPRGFDEMGAPINGCIVTYPQSETSYLARRMALAAHCADWPKMDMYVVAYRRVRDGNWMHNAKSR